MTDISSRILAKRLMEARFLEHRRRSFLLETAKSNALDLQCSHVLVCHAENGALRAARLGDCLRKLGAKAFRSHYHASRERIKIRKNLALGPASVAKAMQNSWRAKAIYRLLVRLATTAGEPAIGSICRQFVSQEQALLDTLASISPVDEQQP